MSQYKVQTRNGLSPAMDLSAALRHAEKLQTTVKGPIVLVREGGEPDFHPHPDNRGQYFLARIIR